MILESVCTREFMFSISCLNDTVPSSVFLPYKTPKGVVPNSVIDPYTKNSMLRYSPS